MTNRQRAFVNEYLIDLNATQAAIRAGYSKATANRAGTYTLSNPVVAKAVNRELARRAESTQVTGERVVRELKVVAFSDVSHYQIDNDGNLCLADGAPEDAMRAVASVLKKVRKQPDGTTEVEIRFQLWNKPNALRMLGEHLTLRKLLGMREEEAGAPEDNTYVVLPAPRRELEAGEVVDSELEDDDSVPAVVEAKNVDSAE